MTSDQTLLDQVSELAHQAGKRLLAAFSPTARPANRAEILAAGQRIERIADDGVRSALTALRPGARWLTDSPEEHDRTQVLPGEWWVTDMLEGGVNFVHGSPEWTANITLVRDNQPVLAVVHQPVGDLTYTAMRGAGAHLNGVRLAVSWKTRLADAIVATSQAGGDSGLNRATATAIESMFGNALYVRQTVPSTFPILAVAAGHADVYWRHGPDLPSLAPGVLLATEAGALATDLTGAPWRADSADALIAPPVLHTAALNLLSETR